MIDRLANGALTSHFCNPIEQFEGEDGPFGHQLDVVPTFIQGVTLTRPLLGDVTAILRPVGANTADIGRGFP